MASRPASYDQLLQFLKKAAVMSLTAWGTRMIHCFTHLYFFLEIRRRQCRVPTILFRYGDGTAVSDLSSHATGIDIMNIDATCQLF